MSPVLEKLEYDSGKEPYEFPRDEVEEVAELLNDELDITYFEEPRGDSVAHVQEHTSTGLSNLGRALEGSDSNLKVRDKYLVLEK